MNTELWIYILVLFIVMSALALASKSMTKAPTVKRKDFMTKNELEFWRILAPAAAPLHVAPQVAMSALVTTESGVWKSERAQSRNSFSQKCVDFVLFNDAGVVQLIVELDDRTHKADKDAARDKITASAGYQTMRVRRRDCPDVATLAAQINQMLVPPTSATPVTAMRSLR